jgi:PQQ-dependent dehydrogenase (methanol/ethanol family)
MKHFTFALVCFLSLLASTESVGQQSAGAFVPVTDEMLQTPDPADWLMWRRTLNGWGYSPLDQINRGNVRNLKMVWSRGMGPGVQEATPLVYRGVMYLPNPSDLVQAMNAATGDLLWEYKREWKEDVTKMLPVPSINRNLAIYGNTIIDTSADDQVFALDATSGKLVWENGILDMKESPAQETSGPIIAKGKIFSGRGCEAKKSPLACVIVTHDAKTGKELWRTRTIPMPGEPGDETWGGIPYDKRSHVGTWMVPSYDPDLNMLFIGTSVTSPAPKFMLAGNDLQYLYHNSTLALNADTGKIVWYFQHIVDHWDFDHPFERLLVDTAVAPDRAEVTWINPKIKSGERRKVVTGVPGKTGIVYTLDRQTGEFLWAKSTVMQNVVSNIDGATGRATVNPETVFTAFGQKRFVCPTVNGGKNFQAGAYSPVTNVMYYPLQNACSTVTAVENTPSTAYAIQNNNQIAPGTDKIGTIHAISVETGKTIWKYEQRAGYMSLVATGGGLILGGDTNGHFRAFDQNTGSILWDISLGSPVTGYPITYAVAGKQYVAVSTGNSLVSSGLNRLAPELHPSNTSNVFVFSLPD